MADFRQATKWLEDKQFIRRPCWQKDSYWKLGKDSCICWKDETIAHVHLNQVNANDWELYEDRRVKCIYCKKPIHIDSFGGIKKEGMFCNNTLCMIQLIQEQEKAEARLTQSFVLIFQ